MSSHWQCNREGYVIVLDFVVAVVDPVHTDNFMRWHCYDQSAFDNAWPLRVFLPQDTPLISSASTRP